MELQKQQRGLFFAQIYAAETAVLLQNESSSPCQLMEVLNFAGKYFSIAQKTEWQDVTCLLYTSDAADE